MRQSENEIGPPHAETAFLDPDIPKALSQRKPGKLDAVQRDNLVSDVLAGKDVQSVALDAGYSEATAQGRIYQIICASVSVELPTVPHSILNEIIGTLVQPKRFDIADLFPESDFLQQAKRLGFSHFIKK